MPSRSDRNDFGPPSDAGRLRSFGLALLVHGLLIGALTWGVNWKRSDTSPSFSAELWSSTAQQAAPALTAPPSPPPLPLPTPSPSPPVETPRPAAVAPPPAPVLPSAAAVDIALEDEKKRKLLKQKLERAEEEKQDRRQAAMDAKAEKEKNRKEEAKQLTAKQQETKQQELAKLEAAKLAATKKAAVASAAAASATTVNAAAVEAQRKQNLARAMGIAGATGDENATGSAKASSGPSSGYGAKVRAKVKPNIVFTEAIDGNPKAEVEVRSASDGNIISQRLLKSSGNKAWDDAVIKAIDRTESMPRDTDGRVPAVMILEFRPRD